jgi:imidazolonepropionase-like amidohydrolase
MKNRVDALMIGEGMRKQSAWMIALGILCIAAGLAGISRQSSGPAVAAAAEQGPSAFLIKNARVFDGERTIELASVLVRDGMIVSVGSGVTAPEGTFTIDASGKTLLPGLIDSHTHAFADALERALVFGVTTELDMFTDHRMAARWRAEQRKPEGAPGRADIFSAGTLVTSPKGHGTEYGMAIPTISAASEAAAFVDARLAEGSDYIKIVYEDGSGFDVKFSSITPDVLRALISATKARGKLAVVHVGSRRAADEAIASGASGLVHLFSDEAPSPDFAPRVTAAKAFVIPTLSVNESASGVPSGASLAAGSPFTPFLTQAERTALNASFPRRPGSTRSLKYAFEATRVLHHAGVPILAGTDAPNPGTSHGASMHRELELLVMAGLSPAAALTAATAAPARAFGLADRGRIAPGLRADLLLVAGNPAEDITATRAIDGVWKRGVRIDRRRPPNETRPTRVTTATGLVSDFDGPGAEPTAAFGAGWQVSTDSMMGGHSTARLQIVRPGARQSAGALEISGTIASGAPYAWAGAMFFPADTPMSPADVSRFKEIVFQARGDGREYQVMAFATKLGTIPASRPFIAGPEWQEFVMPLAAFSNIDGSDLRGLLFSANSAPGGFRLVIDHVRLR